MNNPPDDDSNDKKRSADAAAPNKQADVRRAGANLGVVQPPSRDGTPSRKNRRTEESKQPSGFSPEPTTAPTSAAAAGGYNYSGVASPGDSNSMLYASLLHGDSAALSQQQQQQLEQIIMMQGLRPPTAAAASPSFAQQQQQLQALQTGGTLAASGSSFSNDQLQQMIQSIQQQRRQAMMQQQPFMGAAAGAGGSNQNALLEQLLLQNRATTALQPNNNMAYQQLLQQHQLQLAMQQQQRQQSLLDPRINQQLQMSQLLGSPFQQPQPQPQFAGSLLDQYIMQQQQQQQIHNVSDQHAHAVQALLTANQPSDPQGSSSLQFPTPQTNGIALALPSDVNHLSGYQIFIRHQLEFFVSEQSDCDTNVQGRKKRVKLGQIGMRCKWCAHTPLRQRGRGSVYYPQKMSGVYQAGEYNSERR